MDLTQILFKEVRKTYRAGLYEKKTPKFCSFHDILKPIEKNAHNCLGCNLADLTNAFDEVLKCLSSCTNLQAAFSTYFMWLNVFVERYNSMLNSLGVPEQFRKREFWIFPQIKHWANFQKHPKHFLFVHHAEFGCPSIGLNFSNHKIKPTIIDQKFVSKYYCGENEKENLRKALENKKNVFVAYPDPRELMKYFCAQSQKFTKLIEDNPIYRKLLSEVSTLMDYFTNETEN